MRENQKLEHCAIYVFGLLIYSLNNQHFNSACGSPSSAAFQIERIFAYVVVKILLVSKEAKCR